MRSVAGRMKSRESTALTVSGLVMLLLWCLAEWLSVELVTKAFERVSRSPDSGVLLMEASKVVLMNGFRISALCLGWFLLGDGMAQRSGKGSSLSWLVPAVAIPLTCLVVPLFREGVGRAVTIPIVLGVAMAFIIRRLMRKPFGWGPTSIAILFFLFSLQWLHVIPLMTSRGVGWGELSSVVRVTTSPLGREGLLNWYGISLFGLFFFSGAIIVGLMTRYGTRCSGPEDLREQGDVVPDVNGSLEMRYLAHDLKRPLTTIVGLGDIIASGKTPDRVRAYGQVIGEAGRSMEAMISDILHDDHRCAIPLRAFLNAVFTRIGFFPWRETVSLDAPDHVLEERVSMNEVRVSRALVNLLDNAARANNRSGGKNILLSVRSEGELIRISVIDEGCGFPEDRSSGSSWSSTGIGLQYVRMVAEQHGGRCDVANRPEGGAEASLLLRRDGQSPRGRGTSCRSI